MYLGLCSFGVMALAWAVAFLATRPDAVSRGVRERGRRAARLRACADRATLLDIEEVLRSHPLPDPVVARALGAAAEHRIGARTMWCWADRFGADKLVLALDAEVAERRLQRYLDAGTAPDWNALEIFARLNREAPPADDARFDLDGWATASESGALVATDADLSQFDHLPPIFEPGLPVARSMPPPGDAPSTPPRAGGDDPWPMVA